MKIGVSSYSYIQYLAEGRMDLVDVIECAARIGYEGFEFANIEFPIGQDRLDYARKLSEACQRNGLTVCGYATAGDFYQEDLEVEIQRIKSEIDVAKAMGSPTIRIDLLDTFKASYQTMGRCIRLVEQGIRELADYAEKNQVLLTTENHGRVFLDSISLEQLVSQVGHDNFRILADIGNFADGDEDCAKAMGYIAHLVSHVHIKDFHIKDGGQLYPGEGWYVTRGGDYIRGAIVGHGNVPLVKCLKALSEVGYDGWLVVEFEGIEDPEMATDLSLKNIKRILESLKFFKW